MYVLGRGAELRVGAERARPAVVASAVAQPLPWRRQPVERIPRLTFGRLATTSLRRGCVPEAALPGGTFLQRVALRLVCV